MSVLLTEEMPSVVNVQAVSIMPADPNRKPITVRAEPAQHEAWVAAATRDGRPLSQWLARLADIASGYVPTVKPRKKRTAKPATKPKRRKAT